MSSDVGVACSNEGLSIDQTDLAARIDHIANQAASGCGSSFEFYVQKFSRMIDLEFGGCDTAQRNAALDIARTHDYASPAEIVDLLDWLEESGYCKHGLTSQTCPCGCFEV